MAVTTILTYQLNQTTKQFDVTFEYLSRSFVALRLKNNNGALKDLIVGTDYKWISATRIELTDATVALAYDFLEIKRNTSTTQRIVNFQDGSILRASDLNTAELQPLHVAEEARDAAQLSISINADGQMDAQQRRIVNVADGIDPSDAATLNQLTGQTSFIQQQANDASKSAGDALGYRNDANDAAARALVSEQNAKASETKSKTSETNSATSATASEQSAVNSQASASTSASSQAAAAGSATAAANSATDAASSKTAAAGSAAAALTQGNRAKSEADRAKAAADSVAGNNELVNALNSVDPTTHVVDFKALPKVNGTDLTASLSTGGLQSNSKDICGDGSSATNLHDNLNDNFWAGKNFVCHKGALNPAKTATLNNAPLEMEYTQAVVADVYGTWTPTSGANSGTEGRTRVQTMFDKNTTFVRGYHFEDSTWTPWKSVATQFTENLSGTDLNNAIETGNYWFSTATNKPVISSGEAVSRFLMSVHAVGISGVAEDVMQEVVAPNLNVTFRRYRLNNVWSRWWNDTATVDVDTLAGGSNLNNLTNGYWGIPQATALNQPTGHATTVGEALVLAYANAAGRAYQHYTETQTGRMWVRFRPSTSGAWTAWKEIFTIASGSNAAGSQAILDLIQQAGKPVTLAAEGVGDYDAVTVKQLRAGGGGTGGGSAGIITGFMGEVQWFNGSRQHIPDGWTAADGQILNRIDYPDLVADVIAGKLRNTTEANWLIAPADANPDQYLTNRFRGHFSLGNGSTTFRLPDLNGSFQGNGGTQILSTPNLYLRGSAPSTETGHGGQIHTSGGPNLSGGVGFHSGETANIVSTVDGVFSGQGGSASQYRSPGDLTAKSGAKSIGSFQFNANSFNKLYGASPTEFRPASAIGIWIIRTTGAFSTGATSFTVYNKDAVIPANGTQIKGGEVKSIYTVGGATPTDEMVASLHVVKKVGDIPSAGRIAVFSRGDGTTTHPDLLSNFNFYSNGHAAFPAVVHLADGIRGGNYETNSGVIPIYAGRVELNAEAGETSMVQFKGKHNDVSSTTLGAIYAERADKKGPNGETIPNGGDITISVAGGTKYFQHLADGNFTTPLGTMQWQGSDIKLKDGVVDAKAGGLERINAIKPREFTWKHDGRKDRGYIAQEVAKVDDRYTFVDSQGTLNVSQTALISDLIASVQTLTARVAELEAKQ